MQSACLSKNLEVSFQRCIILSKRSGCPACSPCKSSCFLLQTEEEAVNLRQCSIEVCPSSYCTLLIMKLENASKLLYSRCKAKPIEYRYQAAAKKTAQVHIISSAFLHTYLSPFTYSKYSLHVVVRSFISSSRS